ncbi:MAG: ABC transporter ATP-binding protein [Dongiales bacterium]
MSAPLLEVRDLAKSFEAGGGLLGRRSGARLQAVRGVSFDLDPGETLGLVGESGCGKTTVARMVVGLIAPSSGRIVFEGVETASAGHVDRAAMRGKVQIVFQDPYTSLNPRLRVAEIIAEPLLNLGLSRRDAQRRVAELMATVRLQPEHMSRFPHAFSGGQRQRIGIARALAPRPRLIVCDEAVSALDVSIQAQILNLLADIQRDFSLTLLFISHNLAVVRHLCHRIAVMYLGQIVELASETQLFEAPQHPYTQALIAAVPEPDPDWGPAAGELTGDLPDPSNPPPGCAFHSRCPRAREDCRQVMPALRELAPGHQVRCHYPG